MSAKHTFNPPDVGGLRSSPGWFDSSWPGWQYPTRSDPLFPDSSHTRSVTCPLCGAPSGAFCVSKRGKKCEEHKARYWAAFGLG